MHAETNLADGAVLVLAPDGSAAGTGFAVSERLLVTCSHVVQPAPGEPPPDTVDVVFHATGDRRETRVSAEATVVRKWWRGCEAEDIAFLRVGELPVRVIALPLGSADGTDRDEVDAFGYPEAGEIEGLGAAGQVVRQVTESGRPLLQLRSSEITTGFSGGPLWDRRKRRVIGMVTSISVPDRYGRLREAAFATPTEVLRKICLELQPSNVPPFRGLSPFDAEHAEFFFGRDKLVKGLVSGLRADPRFLALLGPSGSGKSSVIGAGLIPRLKAGGLPGSRDWGTVTIRPHADPFAELTKQGLEGRGLTESFGQWMRASGYQRGVLVIDQFEELLVLTPAGFRADFVAQLVKLLDSSLPVTVVLVMRNDFYGRLDDRAPTLLQWVDHRLLNILPLEESELRQIVTKPAERVGLRVGEGLVEVILEEAKAMGAEGGAIPSTILSLLEFALTKLWERSHQEGERELTPQVYQDLGGISGALTQWADDAYHALDDQKRPVARSIFLDLVHIADEEEMSDIRQRKDLSRLCPAIKDRGSVEEVVNVLAAKRLVITGERQASVELIHDVLVQKWDRLRSWISEERPFRRWLQEIQPALRSWTDYVGRDRGGAKPDWLRGQRLVEAEYWLETCGTDLLPDLKELIKDSIRERGEEAQRERQAEALRLAAHSEQAMRTVPPAPVVALALAVESVLTEPTVQGDIAIRSVLRLHPRTLARIDHDRRVTAVAFSPDGTRLATGSTNGSARVFNAVTGAELARLDHGGEVTAVAFSPDGTRLATGSTNGSARVFNAVTWAVKTRWRHQDAVYAVAFSPDGTRLATGSIDGSARVFDLAGHAELVRLKHDGPVYAVAFGPDGTRLATGSTDHSARVFDVVTGTELGRLQHDHGVYAVAFGPDGTRLATGCSDHSARVFDVVTRAELARLEHDGPVCAVAFSPDAARAATGSDDGSARVFDPATGSEKTRLGHGGEVTAVAFSPDGTQVATGSTDDRVRVFDVVTGAELACLEHDDGVYAVAFSPDGARVVTGSWDRSARVFDVVTGAERARLDHGGRVHAVAFSPDGAWVTTGSEDQSARVFDAATGKVRACLVHADPVHAVAFSPDGAWVATGSTGHRARIFNAATGAELAWVASSTDGSARVFDVAIGAEQAQLDRDGEVTAVAFSPDGTWVATGCDDGSTRVFTMATGAELAHLDHDDAVTGVAFSPDGTRIATGSEDNLAQVFDTATWAEQGRLDHDGEVTAVAFSPDGTRVATGSGDGSARVLDAVSGAELARLDHDGEVTAVAFSPDGAWVVTGSTDRTARVFEATPGPLVQRALRAMDRPLNSAELRRYSLGPGCRHIREWNRLRGQHAPRSSAGN